MKYIKRLFNLDKSEITAFYRYYFTNEKLGCTSFIDGNSMSYGYGEMNGNIGAWEFQLPFWFSKKFDK